MSRKSRQMPPRGALTWPSSEVPVPNAITGTRSAAHKPHDVLHVFGGLRKNHRVRRLVGDPGRGVAVLFAHRLRGDSRLPNRAASAAITVVGRVAVLLAPLLLPRRAPWLPVLSRFFPGCCATWRRRAGEVKSRRVSVLLRRAVNPSHVCACSIAPTPNRLSSRPLCPRRCAVEPGWIDYNGHLNMAYYNVLFDRAVDEVYELLGCGLAYVEASRHSCFTAEVHVRYLRELHAGDPVRVTFQLLGLRHQAPALFRTALSRRGRLALGHVGEHGAACRHGGEEDRGRFRDHRRRACAHESRAWRPADPAGRRTADRDAWRIDTAALFSKRNGADSDMGWG